VTVAGPSRTIDYVGPAGGLRPACHQTLTTEDMIHIHETVADLVAGRR
jgi:hypothetical protein